MSSKKTRVQFDLPASKIAQLEELMEETDSETRRELFNNALTLLQWAIEQRQEGYEIASYHREHKDLHIVKMPALNHVTRKRVANPWKPGEAEMEPATNTVQ